MTIPEIEIQASLPKSYCGMNANDIDNAIQLTKEVYKELLAEIPSHCDALLEHAPKEIELIEMEDTVAMNQRGYLKAGECELYFDRTNPTHSQREMGCKARNGVAIVWNNNAIHEARGTLRHELLHAIFQWSNEFTAYNIAEIFVPPFMKNYENGVLLDKKRTWSNHPTCTTGFGSDPCTQVRYCESATKAMYTSAHFALKDIPQNQIWEIGNALTERTFASEMNIRPLLNDVRTVIQNTLREEEIIRILENPCLRPMKIGTHKLSLMPDGGRIPNTFQFAVQEINPHGVYMKEESDVVLFQALHFVCSEIEGNLTNAPKTNFQIDVM